MRFHVDAWDPSYGSSVEEAEGGGKSTAKVDPAVEVPVDRWAPIPPTPVGEPGAVLFIDGVRRVEARVWIEQSPAPDENGVLRDREPVMALCASYAAGVVCCCPGQGAHLLKAESFRGLFTTARGAEDVSTTAGVYRAKPTADDASQNIAMLLTQSLQRELGTIEKFIAEDAREVTHDEGVDNDLLVIDGPLRDRTHLPRAIGYIKSHRTVYLPPELNAMIGRLKAGERTPIFHMGTSWERRSWYLRMPGRPGSPWAGIVRIECAAELSVDDATALANLAQAVLPRFASIEYKDTRAPQNLVPIAGLERELRRQLGDLKLLDRALRRAARPPTATSG